jgi:hypothetical protein
MDSEEEELEPKVKYSFIVYEEDYEEDDPGDSDEVQPWDPSDIFFRIK